MRIFTLVRFKIIMLLLAMPLQADDSPWSLALDAGTGLDELLIQSGDISEARLVGLDLDRQTEFPEALRLFHVDSTRLDAHWLHVTAEDAGPHDELDIAALSALWRWGVASGLFFDAGIGFSYLSDDQFLDVKTGSQTGFVLDFALGHAWSKRWEASLRYRHYSNGYTSSPNPGLDFAVLQIAYRFPD